MAFTQHFATRGKDLLAGGLTVAEIARRHGTPLFVYDKAIIERKLDLLRRTYPPQFSIYYSIKANPNPAILEFFIARGCGLELASAGELHLALRAGCAADKLLFAGPGKTAAELELAVASGVGEIHVESFEEIERLAAIGARLGRRVEVAVRINPAAEAQGGAMRMGGKPAPFGFDEETLGDVVTAILRHDVLDLSGVHLFTGTQILEHELLLQQYRKGLEIARRVAAASGRPVRTIDFGGGLGIPYFPNETALDCEALAAGLESIVAEAAGDPATAAARLVIEPGRFLVGECGIYVASVTSVKVSRGKKYLVLDGGMNHHLAASGNLGQVIKKNFPIAVLDRMDAPPQEKVDVVGPLCTPLDTLGRDVHLPAARAGDLIGVFQSGAYARTSSPLGFLSHVTPPEILVDGDDVRVIRERGRFEDLEGR